MDYRLPHLASVEQLRQWADQRYDARSEFPNLVRRLIKRSNDSILRLELTGGTGVDGGGYDGTVAARTGSPFVPEGQSVWELGVGVDFQDKATRDYKKRSEDSLGVDKAETTFVFVTPRHWPDKEKWAKKRRDTGVWKDVVVFHSDDIFAALEDVPEVHVDFSESLGMRSNGVWTLARWWENYSETPSKLLDHELVLVGRTTEAQDLLDRLAQNPKAHLWIEGQSVEDVMAFVAAALSAAAESGDSDQLERSLVVFEPGAMLSFARTENLLILIPFDESLVRAAELATGNAVILRALVGSGAGQISLPKIPVQAAKKLLVERGVPEDEAQPLALSAFRSVPLLRSRLRDEPTSQADEIAATLAADSDLRRFWLLGAWSAERSGDREIAEAMLGHELSTDAVAELTTNADPVFSKVGSTWRVIAPDLHIRAVAARMTEQDLAAFETAVQSVLGAVDPTAAMPAAERWRAGLYGPGKLHSGDMRTGIATTLAAMGAAGDEIQLGSTATARGFAALLVRALFERAHQDATGELWLSLINEVPLLAEAAPDMFMDALEHELDTDGPLRSSMFADAEEAFGSGSPHVHILWGLEAVAWSELHLARAVDLLARLADLDPGGKLANRPLRSLSDIYRPWLPQTSASLEARLATLRAVVRRHP